MALDYLGIVNAVKQCLIDNNTTTSVAYLGQSCTALLNPENIIIGDPEIMPIRNDRLPAIFIRIASDEEEFGAVGGTGAAGVKKISTVDYQVVGIYPKIGGSSPAGDMLNEVYNFGRNVKAAFREEYRLSSTALWCNATTMDFEGPFTLDGTWCKSFKLKLRAKYMYR